MTQVPPPSPQPSSSTVPVCYRHPKRETYVRCNRCDRPICPDCMNEASVGFQCPECVSDGRKTQRTAKTVFGGSQAGAKGYVTIGLIAINVAVALLSIISSQGQGLLNGGTELTEWGAALGQGRFRDSVTGQQFVGPVGIADGEYYRLLTSMFLHYGLIHLLMNMFALWVLGRSLETVLGPARFLMLYLVSGLGGSVACYLFAPGAATVGASGAVFGLFAALFIILKRLKRDVSQLIPILVLNVVISFVPGISFWGHLGGAVTGAIVAVALAYAPAPRRNVIVASAVVGLLVLFGIAVAVQTSALQGYTPI